MTEKIKVLMVDDENEFRETTKKLLTRRGFETILAASGEEAMEKLEENPDVIVLDIKMPGMDGHEALKEIRRRRPHVPVIMLTGHATMSSAKEALVDGAFDYLTKPCDITLFSQKIREAWEHARHEAPLEEGSVGDVMIPIEDYTTMNGDQLVDEAIMELKKSFTSKAVTGRIMETGHRSILVMDESGKVVGFLAIKDLLEAIMPAYLRVPKPSMADSIQYSPMFWRGMFKREIAKLAKKRIEEIMSPAPPNIEADSSLMEAAYIMVTNEARRLVVVRGSEIVGVIREQDLFFEMEGMLRR
ncbi:MAG: response regulator [Deltaproteobacteria bacterium]|nr:response regulator [Deltaproteobacteria bacterium]MBW2064817.1 response regulator [Deltaproteobacteria bacterium]